MRRRCDRVQQGRRQSRPAVTSSGIVAPPAHRDGLDAGNAAQQHLIGLLGTQRQVSAIAQNSEGRLLAGNTRSRSSSTAAVAQSGDRAEGLLPDLTANLQSRPVPVVGQWLLSGILTRRFRAEATGSPLPGSHRARPTKVFFSPTRLPMVVRWANFDCTSGVIYAIPRFRVALAALWPLENRKTVRRFFVDCCQSQYTTSVPRWIADASLALSERIWPAGNAPASRLNILCAHLASIRRADLTVV